MFIAGLAQPQRPLWTVAGQANWPCMNPQPFDFHTSEKLAERHRATMNKTALYTPDQRIWEKAARLSGAARRRADD